MPLIDWKPEFSVQNDELDTHHKYRIDLLNELILAMKDKNIKEIDQAIVDSLISYSHFHFDSEEKLMETYNYPRLNEHKNEHATFYKHLEKFKYQIDHFDYSIAFKLILFLQEWIIKHIQGIDQDYAPFLKEKMGLGV